MKYIREALNKLEEGSEKEYYYNYDVLCPIYYKGGVIHRDEEAYAKSYEDLCKQVRDDWIYDDDLEDVEEYGSIKVKVNYSDDPKFKSEDDEGDLDEGYSKDKLWLVEKILENTLRRSYLTKEGVFETFSSEKDPTIKDKCEFFTYDEAMAKKKEIQDKYPDDIILPWYFGDLKIDWNSGKVVIKDTKKDGLKEDLSHEDSIYSNIKSNGIYSLNTGWVKHPVQQDIPDIDMEEFEKEFKVWEDKYFDLLDKESNKEEIDNLIEDIYNLRKESIANEGEYGIGNLIFKEFRNLGYLDNLKELKRKEVSKELSLEGLAKK